MVHRFGEYELDLAAGELRRRGRAVEIQPQVGWTKGDCVLWIRDVVTRASATPLSVVYLGDDWTDEHAFAALGPEAITIKVGAETPPSRAAYRVPDVTAVQRLLAELAARAAGSAT